MSSENDQQKPKSDPPPLPSVTPDELEEKKPMPVHSEAPEKSQEKDDT